MGSDYINISRTFPLENYANLKVTLQSSVGLPEDVSEEERKVIRLGLLAEMEQAYYEYVKLVSMHNLSKMGSIDSVIGALEALRKELYNRLHVESQIVSEESEDAETE